MVNGHYHCQRFLEYLLCGNYSLLGILSTTRTNSGEISAMNEKENTARALREERLLTTSMLCRVGIHNWTKWGNPQQRSIYAIQDRYCGKCGIFQQRKC